MVFVSTLCQKNLTTQCATSYNIPYWSQTDILDIQTLGNGESRLNRFGLLAVWAQPRYRTNGIQP